MCIRDRRYVKQIGIIMGITLAGEVLNHMVPLPVPAGVYGLFIMLAALMCGSVKLESVEGSGNFLMDTMTMMFIPATVGIVECIGEVRAVLVPFLIIIGISTLLVMAVTGCMAPWSIPATWPAIRLPVLVSPSKTARRRLPRV